MWWLTLIGAAAGIPLFFLWAAVHELLHIGVLHLCVPVDRWSIKVYPHFHRGSFRFAAASWTAHYPAGLEERRRMEWRVSLAPRLANIVAAVAFPLSPLFATEWVGFAWAIFWGSNLLDLAWGSIGHAESSDLRKASVALDWNPLVLRTLGFSLFIVSAAAWGLLFWRYHG